MSKNKFVNLPLILLLLSHYSHQRALDLKKHLYKYGYLNSIEVEESRLQSAIKEFQRFTGLPESGHMDADTMEMTKARRCGMPDRVQSFNQRESWRKRDLTYKIRNLTKPFLTSQLKDVFGKVIESWTREVNLRISESKTEDADTDVYFNDQDGKGEVLGYAYYPEGGDIYFDTSEDWTLANVKRGTNFGGVLAHELGHSLGIHHSSRRNSLMYPYYSSDILAPTRYDINTLKDLYGRKPVLDNQVFCSDTSVDAIVDDILIKGILFWNLENNSLKSGPFLLETLYPGLPAKIDAAFSLNKNTYFFEGDVFYKFESTKKDYKRKIISVGFGDVPSNVDAAFYNPNSKTIYIFKNSKYYTINAQNSENQKLIVNEKKISEEWSGVPDNIDAANWLGDNSVLIIKKSKCYRVHLNSKKVQNEDCISSLFKC